MSWWQSFFDDTYHRVWRQLFPEAMCTQQAETLCQLLELGPGARVLDAPCGYGRVALPLARSGLTVVGIDGSPAMLDKARTAASEESPAVQERLHWLQGRLENEESFQGPSCQIGPFDAATHLFSSLGYADTETDRLALQNIRKRLRPGAPLFLETMHRDAVVHRLAKGLQGGGQGSDGTVLREHHDFDPVSSMLHIRWTWRGVASSGQRESHMRVYTVSELFGLLRECGFEIDSAFEGISARPFERTSLGEVIGILARAGG